MATCATPTNSGAKHEGFLKEKADEGRNAGYQSLVELLNLNQEGGQGGR